jgi:hypothetical protein
MDSKACLSDEAWQLLLDETNWNHIILRDKRYDGVLHLVTTADGIEETYTASNNTIRTEVETRNRFEFDVSICLGRSCCK